LNTRCIRRFINNTTEWIYCICFIVAFRKTDKPNEPTGTRQSNARRSEKTGKRGRVVRIRFRVGNCRHGLYRRNVSMKKIFLKKTQKHVVQHRARAAVGRHAIIFVRYHITRVKYETYLLATAAFVQTRPFVVPVSK